VWWGTLCDTNSNMCQRSTRQRIHAAKEARFSHVIVNRQILWHKAIRLIGLACCQDAAVAAVRKHAHYSLPQGVLQTCVGEQALQKLQSGTFVTQAFTWFRKLLGHPAFMQHLVPMTNISQQCMPVITADLSAALEHNRQGSERSASVIENDLTSLLAISKFSLLCNSNPLSNPRWMHVLCFCSSQSGSCWLQSSCWSFASRFGQCRSWPMRCR